MADVNIFIDNVKMLCKRKSLPLGYVLAECNLNKDFLNSAKKRQTLPSTENLLTVANYFDVSVDYLLGIEKKATPQEQPLSETDLNLQELINDMNIEELKQMLEFASFLKQKRKQ